MQHSSKPTAAAIIGHLKQAATFQDFLGRELQAANLYSAITSLQKSGIPLPGSEDAKQLDELLVELDDFLDESGLAFLAKEVRQIRIALDE